MKNKKKQQNPHCESCGHFVPIGEGDHLCDENYDKMLVSDYAPTEDYLWCGGKQYTAN